MRLWFGLLVTSVLFAAPAGADFDDGVAAYEKGDCEVADRELRPLALAGNAVAMRLMGMLTYICGEETDNPYSLLEFQRLREVEEGHGDHVSRLGVEYDWAMRSPRDPSTAAAWFSQAVDAGDPVAEFVMASFLDRGIEVPQDHERAVSLLLKAARCPDVRADYFLAVHFRDGIGTAIDKKEAFNWFRTAAERGDLEAYAELGRIYLQGDGVPIDDSEAFRWLVPPAAFEFGPAQFYLGTMYRDGRGTAQDLLQAYKYFYRAKRASRPVGIADTYFDVAGEAWVEVSRRLTPEEIGTATDMATGKISEVAPQTDQLRRRLCRAPTCCSK